MSVNINKLALVVLALIPNAYLVKSMLYNLPDFTMLLYFALYGLMLVAVIRKKSLGFNLSIHDAFIFVWIVYGIGSLFYSPSIEDGLTKMLKLAFISFSLIYAARMFLVKKEHWDFFVKSFVTTSFVIQLFVILAFVQAGMPLARFTFYGAHPIPLGLLGAVSGIFVTAQLLTKRVGIVKYALIFSTSLWVVFISASKGPLVALILGLVLMLPTIVNSIKSGILFAFAGTIAFYFVSKTEQYETMLTRLLYTSQDQSTAIRFMLFDNAVDLFSQNPLLGAGVGAFFDYYPHNIVLEVLAEGGLVYGFVLGVFLIWLSYKYMMYIIHHRKNHYVYEPIILTIVSVAVLMVSFTYVDLKFLFFGFGSILALKQMKQTPQETIIPAPSKKRLFKKYRFVW